MIINAKIGVDEYFMYVKMNRSFKYWSAILIV